MVNMKKIITMIVALAMVVSMGLPSVYAEAEDDLTVNDYSLVITEVDSILTVSLECSKAITAFGSGSGVMSIRNASGDDASQYFTLNTITAGVLTDMDSNINDTAWRASASNYEDGDSMASGTWAIYTYTVSAEIPEGIYTFVMTFGDDCNDVYFELYSCAEQSIEATYSVSPAAYTAGISADKTLINVDDTLNVSINVDGTAGSFATSQITLTYDSTHLLFDPESKAHTLNGASLNVNGNEITIVDHGETQNNGVAYVLAFTGKAVTENEAAAELVKLTSAAFDQAQNAELQNMTAIKLNDATKTVSAAVVEKRFTVELDDKFQTTLGESVYPGEDFTFTAKDIYYDYVVFVNGQENVAVYDETTGVWTISNVQENLKITATATPKKFDVEINGQDYVKENDGVGKEAAEYKKDYSFTLISDEDYTYSASITINGIAASTDSYTVVDNVYTIKGGYITGDIVITAEREKIAEYTVTIQGDHTDVLTSDKASVKQGETVKLTVNPLKFVTGYTYSYTVNGKTQTPVDNKIVISNVQENLTVVVTATPDLSASNVSIKNAEDKAYLTLNGKTMYLIQVTTKLDDDRVYTYGGQKMYWSQEYNNGNGAYVFLVVDNEADLTLEQAIANIDIVEGEPVATVVYSGDVNMAGGNVVDANDAQLVYEMYQTKSYSTLSGTNMEKFLRADMNCDGMIDSLDAAAVVDKIFANS